MPVDIFFNTLYSFVKSKCNTKYSFGFRGAAGLGQIKKPKQKRQPEMRIVEIFGYRRNTFAAVQACGGFPAVKKRGKEEQGNE